MALLEKHRNTVYHAFVPLLGEEVTEAVLAYFPARDVEEMVTKEHLDRRFAEQNADIDRRFAEFRAYVDRRFAEQNTEIDRRFAEFRAYVDRRFDEFRAEQTELRLDVARQINGLQADLTQQLAAQADKTFHRMLTLAGVGLGVITILFAAFS